MHGVALACASMAGSGISLSTEVRRTAMAATIVDSPDHRSNWLHQCVQEVVGMLFVPTPSPKKPPSASSIDPACDPTPCSVLVPMTRGPSYFVDPGCQWLKD